jgi:hypothetical protein
MNTQIMKALEYDRNGMFVPPDLTKEIVSKVKVRKNKSILVLFSYEMLPVLKELRYKNVTLGIDKVTPVVYYVAKYYGYNVVNIEDLEDMKFDVVLGNPPFSKANEGKTSTRKKNLYPHFFEWTIKNSDMGAMIMPQTQKQVQEKHNRNIVDNCYEVMMIEDSVFKIATSVWCVFFDKKTDKRIEDFTVKTKMNSFNWKKGKMSSSAKDWQSLDGYEVIHSVRKDGLIILKSKKFNPNAALPSDGFAVVLGITANKTFIIPCKSQMFGGNVYTVWFKTKKEAENFQKKLDKKINEIDHLRGNMGVLTINGLEQIDFN